MNTKTLKAIWFVGIAIISLAKVSFADATCLIKVTPSQSIQQAVNQAKDGCVIWLSAGNFTQDIVISDDIIYQTKVRNLTIVGQGLGQTVIYGNVKVTYFYMPRGPDAPEGRGVIKLQDLQLNGNNQLTNGVFALGSRVWLDHVKVTKYTGSGAQTYTANAELRIENSLFTRNAVGVQAVPYSSILMINNTIAFNTYIGVAASSGAVYDVGITAVKLVNNIIYANGTGLQGFPTYGGFFPNIFYEYNDNYGNGKNFYLGVSLNGNQATNISKDPLFVDPSVGNYRLKTGSPCIQTGDPATPRHGGPRANMGAF